MKLTALALLLVSGVACASTVTTPAQVSAAVDRQGAKAFFARLDDRDSDALFEKIGSGQSAWIRLAPKLAAGADAGNGEGLSIALAESLPKNAPAVLAVVDSVEGDAHILAISRVCGIPFNKQPRAKSAGYSGWC